MNLYEILGLNEDATSTDIKLAFHKLALKLHPDKNIRQETEATEKMKILNHAFSILADTEQKKAYDIKFKIFKTKTTFQDKKSCCKNNSKNFYESQSTSNFFKPSSDQVFTFNEWRVTTTSMHLFIFHPSIQGYKDNITCWYINKPYISLPINNNAQLARTIQKRLMHIIPIRLYSSGNDEIEITIKLPPKDSNCLAILDIVLDIYQVPFTVYNFVKDKMGFASPTPIIDNSMEFNFI